MTIGIAAITDKPKGTQYPRGTGRELIVLASDRLVTFSATGSAVKVEAEGPKLRGLLQMTAGGGRCGWYLLFAGATDDVDPIVRAFRESTDGWEQREPTSDEIADALHGAIVKAREAAYVTDVLTPWQITKELFLARPKTLEKLPREIEDDLLLRTRKFEEDWGCHLLVCGFDGYDRPTILRADEHGKVTTENNPGYAAIGAGEDLAIARLTRRNAQPSDQFEAALFKVFDAKLEAELEPSVGPALDAWVLTLKQPLPMI